MLKVSVRTIPRERLLPVAESIMVPGRMMVSLVDLHRSGKMFSKNRATSPWLEWNQGAFRVFWEEKQQIEGCAGSARPQIIDKCPSNESFAGASGFKAQESFAGASGLRI